MKHPVRNRILSALLVLVMVISMLPISTVAATSATWTKVELSDIQFTDTILITMTNPSGVTYALPTASATNWGPTAMVVTVNGTTITTANSADYGWTITATDGGYTIGADGIFLNNVNNNNNGVRVNKDQSVWTLDGNYLKTTDGAGNGRWLGVYDNNNGVAVDNPNWRAYKNTTGNTKNQTVGFWKLGEGSDVPPSGTVTTTAAPTETTAAPAPTGTEYVKTASIAAGDVVVMYNAGSGKLVSSKASGYKLTGVDAAPADGKLVTDDATVAWTVGVVDGKYTFTQGEMMLGMVQSGSYVNMSTKATDGHTGWVLEKGTAAGTWYAKNATMPASSYGEYYLEYYSGFTAYASSSPSDGQFGIEFYKVQTEPAVPTYTKTEKLLDGDKVLMYNAASGMVMDSDFSGYKLGGVAVTPENDKIVNEDDSLVWTVKLQDGKYTFSNGEKVLGIVQSGNYVNPSTKASDGYTTWVLEKGTAPATWYVKNETFPANGTYGPYYIEYYSGYTVYASDAPSDGQFGIVFYRLGDALAEEPEPEEPTVPVGTPATLVTDVTTLSAGDEVVIVAPGKSAVMGPSSGNYYASVTDGVTLSSDNKTVYFDDAKTQTVILGEGATAGTWSFQAAGVYLSANNGGSNYLKNEKTVTADASWTVQIDTNGIATIKSNGSSAKNWIRYNASSPRFSCYGSGQADVAIYKLAPEGSKLTSADKFVSGTYAMVVSGGYGMGAVDGTWVSVVQPVIEDDVLTDAKGGIWTLTVNGSNVTITDKNGVAIKPKGGNSNGLATGSYEWAWSFDAATATFTFAGQGSDTVKLASNASEDPTYGGFHKFRAYKNSTISGNASGYPCAFTLYPVSEGGTETQMPEAGAEVVIYNLSAEGVLAAQNDTESLNSAAATIEGGKAQVANGGVLFKVEKNGDYYRFYNETYGYLCSNGTGNNAFYSKTASDDADWTLAVQGDGYTLESRTAKFNEKYSQYLEYYSDSYKTYSMYNVTDYDIYTFQFYPLAEGHTVTEGIVNAPKVVTGTLLDAYMTVPYEFTFTVDAPFGVKELKVMLGNDELTATLNGGTYYVTIPGEKVNAEKLEVVISGKDNKDVAIRDAVVINAKDEPVITDLTPASGTETGDEKKPVISAVIANAGEDATVTMTVNGEEVKAAYADGKVTYTPESALADGRVGITVTVKRADGKETAKSWSFTVGKAKYQLYFGQLHSHTTYSDGSGSLDSALEYIAGLPESANVDFVAFTDHSNYFDASGAANPEDALYDMSKGTANSQKLWSEYKGAIEKFNNSQSDVVAIGGFEMTWSGGPGHINTFNTPGIVSRNNTALNNKASDAGMKLYYSLISRSEGVDSINQFNHPGSTFGTFTDFAYWDALVDTRIQLVEVGNGEGQIGAGGYYPSYEYYTMALDKGWHVAPTNNQDNHKGKWGNANNARDVILTDDFSEQGIYEAIRDRRVYATEDKNLEVYYTVNGKQLGSVFSDVPEKLELSVTLYDPDAADSISKVEVIVNSGKTVHTWSDPAVLATGELTVTLAPDYSYYYIRITQGDGDLAVTAPVWVGETLKLGISAVECGTATPVTDEEVTITTTLFNSESTGATVKSLVYTVDGNQVVGTDEKGYTIPANGTVSAEFKYTPKAAKLTKVTVTAVVEQDGKEYTFTMDISLDVQDATKLVYIGIDASHYNEYVNGNYKDSMGNFSLLAADYSVRTVQLNTSAELIAACSNPKFKAIIMTAPSRRSAEAQAAEPLKVYTAEELAAIKAFNENGGTVILAGWSDHYENYPDVAAIKNMKPEEHMAATQNAVLEALGSSLRIGDDATYDDTYNGGQAYRLYFNTYGDSFLTEGVEVDAEHPHDRLYTEVFSHYGGASVYTVDGKLNSIVTPVVFGHSGTYSVDVDQDGLGGTSMPKYEAAEGDKRLMIMATEQLDGRGLIIVSGAAFMSNFEVQATIEDSGSEKNYSNYKICENLLANINPAEVTSIADVQKQTGVGYKYTIEGIVTSNASGHDKDTAFFDCIYVQDETGGICCFPVAGNYKIGDKVRVTGTTEFYQGEMELQVTSIEVIGKGTVEPKDVTAAQINDLSVIGQLIRVKGKVVSFQKENGLVQTIMVKDAKGDTCRVFIDGYITTDEDVKNLKEGCDITVVGISSYDNTFAVNPKARAADTSLYPRIRIRDRADIVCTPATVNPNTGDSFQPVLVLGVLLAAAMGMCVMVIGKKKWMN